MEGKGDHAQEDQGQQRRKEGHPDHAHRPSAPPETLRTARAGLGVLLDRIRVTGDPPGLSQDRVDPICDLEQLRDVDRVVLEW